MYPDISSIFIRLVISLRHGIARDTTLAAASQIAARGSLILSGMIVSHFIGPDEFATYSYFQLTAVLITTMAGMGISILASRAASSELHWASEVSIQRLSSLRLLAICFSTLAAAAAFLLPSSWLHIDGWIERVLLAALTWSGLVSAVFVGMLNGMRKFDVMAKSAFVGSLYTIGGAAFAVILGSTEVAIVGLVVAQFSVIFMSAKVLVSVIPPYSLRIVGYGTVVSALRDIFSVAIPVLLSSIIISTSMWWAGKRLLLQYDGNYEFALFAISLQWFSAVLFIPSSLNMALLPRFFEVPKTANLKAAAQRQSLILRGVFAAVLIAIPVAIGVVLMERLGVLSWIYGINGGRLSMVLLPFMLASVLAAATAILGNAAVAHSGQAQWLAGIVMWGVVFFYVPIIFFPKITVEATGAALLSAYGVLSLYGLISVMKKNRNDS